ncbi:MAG: MFS transporter [Acidobacteria bacterium]|nr:MFS transporter [Acidobacteriota bacterium]
MNASLTTGAAELSGVPWYRELNRDHWRVLMASFMGWVFDGYENYSLFLVSAPALRELLTADQLGEMSIYSGIIVASMLLGVGSGGILGGVVADYIGRRRTMMITILVYSICTGLTGFVQSWPQLALFRFLAGLGMGGEWATGTTLMAESWPTRARAKGLGIMQSAFGWGALTASCVWYLLASRGGPGAWRIVFFLGVLPAFFVLYLRRNVKESEKWLEKRQQRRDLKTLQSSGITLSQEQNIVAGFTLASLFRDPQLRRTVLLCLLMSLGTMIGFWGVSTWIPMYVESAAKAGNFANPARWGALAGVLFTMGSIVGYVSAGFLADLIGRRGMLLFLFVGALVTTPFVFLWTHSPVAIAIAACVNGAFTLGQFAWMAIYSPELFPTAVRATSVSVVFNGTRFVSILGPFVGGVLITRLGGFTTTALLFSCAYVLAICAVPFLPETKGKPLPG